MDRVGLHDIFGQMHTDAFGSDDNQSEDQHSLYQISSIAILFI